MYIYNIYMEVYDGLRYRYMYKLTCSSAESCKDYKYLCITESGNLLKVGP